MDLDVALLPREVTAWPPRVCVVVDELRASSTIVTALDRGCSELFVTRSLADARALGRAHRGVLAGERDGVTPRGFDYNNSPFQLLSADLAGRTFVLSTSNGTAMLARVRAMPVVLVGCLLNAAAVAEAALRFALARDLGIGVICAGILGRFAVEDMLASGLIVERLLATAEVAGVPLALGDGAIAAHRLATSSPPFEAAFEGTETGNLLHEIDQAEDIAYCAQVDVTGVVPILRPGETLRVERLADQADGAAEETGARRWTSRPFASTTPTA